MADVSVAAAGEKVQGEVVAVLYVSHIKELKREGRWPEGFELPAEVEAEAEEAGAGEEGSGSEDDGMPPLERNSNHRQFGTRGDTHREEEEEEEEESEEEG